MALHIDIPQNRRLKPWPGQGDFSVLVRSVTETRNHHKCRDKPPQFGGYKGQPRRDTKTGLSGVKKWPRGRPN